ncbi:3D (Asp-Asp-Asp) domain-containing protein [Flavobacteriaceae bacterium MAR_2010_72]|nr:3D (Asp-Asp-Asp) domain-containing protein [Flavobacteriaceae bacterium MAR_2010_72]
MVFRYLIPILLILFYSCEQKTVPKYEWKSLRVIATAYNSVEYQTDGDPHITAFGDSLKSGLKYIAVSNDLYRLGFKHNTFVTIEGLKGIYLVKDRMHERWKNKIDIYMGTDINAAKEWGRKKVTVHFRVPLKK